MGLTLALIVCIIGLCIWCLTAPERPARELGRLMFFCGLLVFLLESGSTLGPLLGPVFRR